MSSIRPNPAPAEVRDELDAQSCPRYQLERADKLVRRATERRMRMYRGDARTGDLNALTAGRAAARRDAGFRAARASHLCLGFEGCETCRDIARMYGIPLAELRRFMRRVRPEDRLEEFDPETRRRMLDDDECHGIVGLRRQRLRGECLRLLRRRQAANAQARLALLVARRAARDEQHAALRNFLDRIAHRVSDDLGGNLSVMFTRVVPAVGPPVSRALVRAGAAAT